MYYENKIITKIECCGAKFYHKHGLGALDPAWYSKKRPKKHFFRPKWCHW